MRVGIRYLRWSETQKMTYDATWEVLSDLLVALRKKGETIPTNVVKDLRSAKTLLQVLKADPSHIQNIPKIEIFLGNVESCLVSTAQEKFGSEFVDQWMEKLKRARRTLEKEGDVAARFVSGLPRGEHWIRVKISEDIPRKDVEALARAKNLTCKMQKDDFLLISGAGDDIKSFVKTLAEKSRSARSG